MGNEAYQQRKDIDLIPGQDGLIHVPKNIVVYLTQDQVEATWNSLCDYAEKNGKVKNFSEINNCIFVGNTGKITPNSVYGKFSEEDVDTLENLNMVPKLNDANRLAQTDKDYNKDNPDYIPDEQNFPLKIWNWYDKGLIDKDQHNAIIRGILFSSGSIHNDWVYSLTGEDNGREKESAILDIHDRRIDDPNVPLTVKGGVNVGDPDNATDRKKLSVFGETELQDGSTFGRLLDTFGEQFPMYFGHLIPDHGQYYKVYINRGEDRYNGEDWDDQTYGTGFGTVEAYKEIVSHTTVNADRGMIIEDGLGDRTDKIIRKTRDENNHTHFDPTGAATHETNGFALSIHHDGAKVKGHTYIQDEGSANRFFKENDIIYKANVSAQNGFEIVDANSIKKNCWFCVDNNDSTDWQYRHFCTTKDNDVEPVVDRWYGHLYYEGTRTIKGREGWKYCYNGEEYYYDGTFHKIENHKNVQSGEIFTLGDDLATYYRMEENPLSKVLEQYQYKFVGIYTDVEQNENPDGIPPVYYVKGMTITVDQAELEYTANLRVRPETDKVYQIKDSYTETNTLYGLIDVGTYAANTYLYWDGIKFKPITEPRGSYNQKQDYGSLTVGTRANGEQDNDTIGRNSLEVGKENEATGDNAVANGQATTAAALNSHAEGLGTEVTGEFSHNEGLGGFAGQIVREIDGAEVEIAYGEPRTNESTSGVPSIISGIASHGEGYGQLVEGKYSHAEGRLNQILNVETTAAHAEGSENLIKDNASCSHVEGELNIIDEENRNAHVEGGGNITNRKYQHLSGALAKNTHTVDKYYGADQELKEVDKPVMFAIGDGDSYKLRGWDGSQGEHHTPAEKLIENRDDEDYEKGNLFAVTEDGDTYVAGHLEVDGTSDLSDRVTIGDSDFLPDHSDTNPALDVLKHSKFREKVTIERDGQATADLDMTWPTDDISLAVKGESLFGDTLTIGEAGDRDEETGTFWANLDESDPFNAKSAFNGLYVHGEIHNERIPQELYTSMPVGNDIVLNEFADKFFVNSSIATSTATYRGSFSAIDYAPHMCELITPNNLDDYTIIEYKHNLPTKYTNQIIFDDMDPEIKPIIFYLNNDEGWTPTTNIHPYETGHTYTKGYYKFVYGVGALINPTKEQIAAWLYNHVWKMDPATQVVNVYDLDTVTDPDTTKYYYVIGEEKYYRYNNQSEAWIEESPSANNNDYCYFQIWDKKDAEPYVLFAETYDDEGNLINSFNENVEEDSEQEMEIICYRYKFSETRHPSSGAILNSKWEFEYQLNNSGFTQAQWAAINSGISGAWMSNIETRLKNLETLVNTEINRLDARVDQEILDRESADNNIIAMFANYYTKTQIDSTLANYYTKTEIDSTLANYYTKTEIGSILANYYTKAQIDSTLANYYTKTEIDSTLANYYTKTETDNKYITLDTTQFHINGYKSFSTFPAKIGDQTYELSGEVATKDDLLNQEVGYWKTRDTVYFYEVYMNNGTKMYRQIYFDSNNNITTNDNNSARHSPVFEDGIYLGQRGIGGNATLLSSGPRTTGSRFILPQSGSGELALKTDIENIMPFSSPVRCSLDGEDKSMMMICNGTQFEEDGSVEGVIMGIIPAGWNFFNWSDKNYTIHFNSKISDRLTGLTKQDIQFSTNVESGLFQPKFSVTSADTQQIKFKANPPAGKILFLYFRYA